MRKVFLETLPNNKNTKTRVVYWESSVGCTVKFIYDEIDGEFNIVWYDKPSKTLRIEYEGNTFDIHQRLLLRCKIHNIIKSNLPKKVRDLSNTRVNSLTVLDKSDFTDNEKNVYWNCICDCGNHVVVKHQYLSNKEKKSCAKCNFYSFGEYLIDTYGEDAIGNIWTKENKISPFDISYKSNKTIFLNCIDCGTTKSCKPMTIVNQGFGCSKCSDGISYPNKFIGSVLNQLGADYKPEMIFDWSKRVKGGRSGLNKSRRIYDYYVVKSNTIIEAHGRQHYEMVGGVMSPLSVEQANDKLKRELALNNGINHYVELDCRKSDMEWIKNSVMASELPSILNFKEEDIDWLECEKVATNNLVVQVCRAWNEVHDKKILCNLFNLSTCTIHNYIVKGVVLGICDYDKNEEFLNRAKVNKKRVRVIKDDKVVAEFDGISDTCDGMKNMFGCGFLRGYISDVCKGKRKYYKGFVFEFINKEEGCKCLA